MCSFTPLETRCHNMLYSVQQTLKYGYLYSPPLLPAVQQYLIYRMVAATIRKPAVHFTTISNIHRYSMVAAETPNQLYIVLPYQHIYVCRTVAATILALNQP
jgi:hypothetical protein